MSLATLALPLIAGAAAIYLLLPRPQRVPAVAGAVCGVMALALAGWFLVAAGWSVEAFLFYLFSALAVVSGTMLVTQRNPARAALAFVVVILSTCGLFLLLAAPFLMAATIVIYAGAIVVTFLFVLMLAQQIGLSDADDRSREPFLATATGFVLLGALLYVLQMGFRANDSLRLADEIGALVNSAQQEREIPRDLADRINALLTQSLTLLEKQEEDLRDAGDEFELRGLRGRQEFARGLRGRIEPLLEKLPGGTEPAADPREPLEQLARALAEARLQQSWLQPPATLALSGFSGPPANTPLENLRYDGAGRPQLPAENAQYLGKALFSDHLLAVELGGTLLMVAAIGAIAIAQRRKPEERTP